MYMKAESEDESSHTHSPLADCDSPLSARKMKSVVVVRERTQRDQEKKLEHESTEMEGCGDGRGNSGEP